MPHLRAFDQFCGFSGSFSAQTTLFGSARTASSGCSGSSSSTSSSSSSGTAASLMAPAEVTVPAVRCLATRAPDRVDDVRDAVRARATWHSWNAGSVTYRSGGGCRRAVVQLRREHERRK